MKLHETPCPKCKHPGSLKMESVFHAKPIGEWSLPGVQTKFVGEWKPVITCQIESCQFTRTGRYDGDSHAVFDAT